jgi:cell wall-associated NlpC family hydrolase
VLKVPPPPKIPSFPIGGSAVIGAATNALGQIAQGDYRPSETLGDLVTAQNVDRDALTKAWGQAQQQAEQPTNIKLDITPGATTRTVRSRDGRTITVRGRVPQEALKAVALAKRYLGTPYHWGGASPQTNFDCSGLLQYVWGQQGVNIPRVTYDQWKSGRPVQRKALQAGDAVFFEPTSRGPGHVGMYIGGGMFIEAPHTGAVVRISRLADRKDYMGARRYG